MKKLILCAALLVLSSGSAFANATIPLVHYKCLACNEFFYSFDGDDLTHIDFITPEAQDSRFVQLADRSKKIKECPNSRGHVFSKIGVKDVKMSNLADPDVKQRVVVIKGGKNLNHTTIASWYCLDVFECTTCKLGSCYTLNNENLVIRDWERQPELIVNLKDGKGIPKCTSTEAKGHAFYHNSRAESVTSYQIATLINVLYWVKDN